MYALAAAKMLKKYSSLSAKEIVEEALKTASEICIYTNDKINVEVIECTKENEVWTTNIKDYYKTTTCRDIVDKKMEIFNDVAFWVFMLNKKQA